MAAAARQLAKQAGTLLPGFLFRIQNKPDFARKMTLAPDGTILALPSQNGKIASCFEQKRRGNSQSTTAKDQRFQAIIVPSTTGKYMTEA